MADNIDVTSGSGNTVACDEVTDPDLGTVKMQVIKVADGTINGTNKLIVSAAGAAKVDGSAVTQPVSGTVTANAGTNLNTSALALESGGNLAAIATSASVLDDWDESDRAKVNTIVGQAGVTAGAGSVAANTPRVTLASDDPAVTSLGILDNVVYAEDTAAAGGDPGVQALSVRQNTAVAMSGASGDYQPFITDGNGRLWVNGSDVTQPVSGTVTVAQATASNLNAQVVGTVADNAADSGNPVKVGGKYNSSPITLDNGDRGDAQLDVNGYLKVNVAAGTASAFDLKQGYGTNNQALTITIASLTNNSARQSTAVDNTSNKFKDAGIVLKVKTGGSSTAATGVVNVYAYGTVDGGTTYTQSASGTNAAITLTSPPNCRLVGVVNAVADATTYVGGPFSVAAAFGGNLPALWGIILENKTGGTLDATGGNHSLVYQGYFEDGT